MFDKYLLIFVDFILYEEENEKHSINDSVVASILFLSAIKLCIFIQSQT